MSLRRRTTTIRRTYRLSDGATAHAALLGQLATEGYRVLRDELLASRRPEWIEAIWRHEPDVPEWLRVLPVEATDDALVLAADDPAAEAAYETARGALEAILAGRRAYLRHLVKGDDDAAT